MANLVVRNLDDRIVKALKRRAARHGRSAETEHRAILETTLVKTQRKTWQRFRRAFRTSAMTKTLRGCQTKAPGVYLIDTNIISEIRKGPKVDRGVRAFFRDMAAVRTINPFSAGSG